MDGSDFRSHKCTSSFHVKEAHTREADFLTHVKKLEVIMGMDEVWMVWGAPGVRVGTVPQHKPAAGAVGRQWTWHGTERRAASPR